MFSFEARFDVVDIIMELIYSSCRLLLLVTIALITLKFRFGRGTEIYVKSSSHVHSPCPVKTCLSLSQLSTKSVLDSLNQNTTLLFLPGDYRLKSEIVITNTSNFSMISRTKQVSIFCHQNASFKFEGIKRVAVKGLKFYGCGNNKIELVKTFLCERVSFVGENKSETALEIDKTKAYFVDTSFIYNTVGSLREPIRILQGHRYQHAYVGGAIIASQSNVTITRSDFFGNRAEIGGAIFATCGSNITILNSSFVGNSAGDCSILCFGGVLYTENGCPGIQEAPVIVVTESEFSNNTATNGAVLATDNCSLSINKGKFHDNVADDCGGVFWLQGNSKAVIYDSEVYSNRASLGGGVVYLTDASSIIINNSRVYDNNYLEAEFGGVIHLHSNDEYFVGLYDSIFENNSAQVGGVISKLDDDTGKSNKLAQSTHATSSLKASATLQSHSLIIVLDSLFNRNRANFTGGVLSMQNAGSENVTVTIKQSNFLKNVAPFASGGVFDLRSVTLNLHDVEFSYNQAQVGGIMRAFQSNILFVGKCTLASNSAYIGGTIYAMDSRLTVRDAIIVVENCSAISAGGGLYLYRSTLHCHQNSTIQLVGNVAISRGGGIYAINSVISVLSEESTMQFTKNVAKLGGGLFLEVASELHIFKLGLTNTSNFCFTSNGANVGGAIFVEDKTYFKTCAKIHNYEDGTDCFIRIISQSKEIDLNQNNSLKFIDNQAYKTGSVLYGGLLDRCTVINTTTYSKYYFNGMDYQTIDGVTYFRKIITIDNNLPTVNKVSEISSHAVQICFCTVDGSPDCGFEVSEVHVKKGEKFNLSLVAVDQISQPLDHVPIYAHFTSSETGLGENQMAQLVQDTCTNVTYSVYSSKSSVDLTVYPDGPCENVGKSSKKIQVNFLNCTCPVGFQQRQSNKYTSCECICDAQLYPFITDPNCNIQTGMLLRDGNFWITNLSHGHGSSSTGYKYLIYAHCPYDYCLPYHVHINLNLVNGADAQCAKNRSGLLCGTCKPGLSLSLGSSKCIPCSKAWHRDIATILISFFVSGILLVVSIMVLNLTVAVGTLNGIIFYANIIGANTSIFFPIANLRFVSIFLSWLNLEIGFDSCFYDGMDTYWKTWLQLSFPIYIIMLVIIIIVASDHSMKFSELIAKKNPVATLTTLILLSYTKLLRIVISSLSFGALIYPDGSHETIWLPDASVKYLKGKHVPLFILGILILFIGVLYTFLLFSWQWLLCHQKHYLLKWIGHPKLHHFIEPYHAPYVFKHRYWTGLLLLVRVVLYLVFALNKSGDPRVNLVTISVVSCCLMFQKGLVTRVYKRWVVEAISMTCYLNMALLSVSTFFSLENKSTQPVFAFISGLIMILLLLLVISYHMFTEICLKVVKKLNKKSVKSSKDEASDVSQIDFDSRDHSPMDESMDGQYNINNRRELSTLPDCGNSLQKQRDDHTAQLQWSNFSDNDTDSEGSMTPLLI